MHTRKGLSLLGIVVATAILSGAMVSFLNTQFQIQRYQFEHRYATLGNLLASEGVELARGVRDTNFTPGNRYDGREWNEGLPDGSFNVDYNMSLRRDPSLSDPDGGFDEDHSSVNQCTDSQFNLNSSDCRIVRETGTDFYTLDTSGGLPESEDVEIYRQITLENIPDTTNARYVEVTSRVKIIGKRSQSEQSQYIATARLYNTDIIN